jgi:hypothetical protein
MVFHTAPNAAEPSVVIRLTERDGTSDGGIIGAGGGGAGTCANAVDGAIAEIERRACKEATNGVEHRMSSLWSIGKLSHWKVIRSVRPSVGALGFKGSFVRFELP